MYTYTSAPKNKSMNGPKVPIELIQHFKNTAQIPRRSFKENQNPKNVHPEYLKDQKKEPTQVRNLGTDKTAANLTKSKIVECDISTIANSYVLQGNFLRKHETYEQSLKRQKPKQSNQNKENLSEHSGMERKQIIKLEYLQKMGFLRPDQKQILSEFRKLNPSQFQDLPKQQSSQKSYNKYYEMMPQKMGIMPPHYSPKTAVDPKKLSQFFSPNGKYMYPSHQFGY